MSTPSNNNVLKDIAGTTYAATFETPLSEAEAAVGAYPASKVELLAGYVGVHKKDEEGILLIDRLTGRVAPLSAYGDGGEHPEWATVGEGTVLGVALLTERVLWYSQRLGALFAHSAELVQPDLMAFEDLSWITASVDDEEEVAGTIDADIEGHRMQVLGQVMGIEEGPDGFATVKGAEMEIEMAYDQGRSMEEAEALTKAQDAGFEAATGTSR